MERTRSQATRYPEAGRRFWLLVFVLVLTIVAACARQPAPSLPEAGLENPVSVVVRAFEDRTGDPALAWTSTGLARVVAAQLRAVPGLDTAAEPWVRDEPAAAHSLVVEGTLSQSARELRLDLWLVWQGRRMPAPVTRGEQPSSVVRALPSTLAEVARTLGVEVTPPIGQRMTAGWTRSDAALAAWEEASQRLDAYQQLRSRDEEDRRARVEQKLQAALEALGRDRGRFARGLALAARGLHAIGADDPADVALAKARASGADLLEVLLVVGDRLAGVEDGAEAAAGVRALERALAYNPSLADVREQVAMRFFHAGYVPMGLSTDWADDPDRATDQRVEALARFERAAELHLADGRRALAAWSRGRAGVLLTGLDRLVEAEDVLTQADELAAGASGVVFPESWPATERWNRSFHHDMDQARATLCRVRRTRLERTARAVAEVVRTAEGVDEGGWSAMHHAAAAGDAGALARLAAAGRSPLDVHGQTPLHVAAFRNAADAAEWLIKRGADLDRRDCYGRTALRLAAEAGATPAATALLAAGGRPGQAPGALHVTAHLGLDDLAALLLAHGWPVETTERDSGEPPLHLAAEGERPPNVRVSVAAGARPQGLDRQGRTSFDGGESPLHLAAEAGHAPVVRVLVEAGARLEGLDRQGRTPYQLALTAGHRELASELITLGYAVDIFAATRLGDAGRVRAFLDQRPDAAVARDPRGWTALHYAADREHPAVVRLLVEHGADVNARVGFESNGSRPQGLTLDDRILRILEAAGAEIDWPRVRCAQTCCNCSIGSFEMRDVAADILPLHRQRGTTAELLHEVGRGQMERGRFVAAARTFGAVERALLAASGDQRSRVHTRLNLARALVHGGRYDDGAAIAGGKVRALERAYAGDPGRDHTATLSNALETLGLAALRRGAQREGRARLTRVLEIRKRAFGEASRAVAFSEMHLAELEARDGRYLDAEQRYQRACWMTQSGFEPQPVAHHTLACRLELAAVRQRLGDLRATAETYRSARRLLEEEPGREPLHLGLVYNNLADLYRARGELDEALATGSAGVRFVEVHLGPDHRARGDLFLTLAQIRRASGDLDRARDDADRALDILEATRGRQHPAYALALVERGWTHLAAGALDAAAADLVEGLVLADHSGAAEVRWQARDALAAHLEHQQRRRGAIFFARQAVELIQRLRRDLATLTPDLQKSFLRDKLAAYRRLAGLLIDEGRLAEAQAVLGMLKDEEWATFTRSAVPSAADTPPAAIGIEARWEERYAEIQADVIARGRALQALKDIKRRRKLTEGESDRQALLRADFRVARRAYWAFVEEVRAYVNEVDPARVAAVGARQFKSLPALQPTLGVLGDGVVALHYLITPARLRVIVTTPDAQVVRGREIRDRDLYRLIAAHRAVVQNPDRDPRGEAQELYDVLVGPIEEDLRQAGAKTLLLSLDGAIRYVPFSALWDGARWLAESYRLSLLVEAARDKLKDGPSEPWTVGGLGTSQATGEFVALPAVRQELDGIVLTGPGDPHGVLPGEIHLDEDFSIEKLRDVLDAGFPVVHVASHFAFRPGTRRDSFLLLGDDGRLSLEQVAEEDFNFRDVDLLTLSACDTAVGAPGADGREVEGLAALFQNLGTPSVLATLWPVADESTSLFMQALYRQMRDLGGRKAEALRAVQLAFLKDEVRRAQPEAERGVMKTDGREEIEATLATSAARWEASSEESLAHPFYWAPFLLLGNFR